MGMTDGEERHVLPGVGSAGPSRRGPAVAFLVSLATTLVGCTPSVDGVQKGQHPLATASSLGSGGGVDAEGGGLIASADALSAADASGNVLLSAGARLTSESAGTTSTTTTIRDEDASSFAPGHYELRTYCVGTGVLSAGITIGGAADSGEPLSECTPQGTVGTVSVDVVEESSPAVVTITPAKGTVAAVAYQLRLSPR